MAVRSSAVGYAFTICRILEFLVLGVFLSLCCLLAAEINALDGPRQPGQIATALVVSVLTLTYTLITLLLHVCGPLPHLPTAIIDAICFLGLLVSTIYIGHPLLRLDCAVVGDKNEQIFSLGDVLNSVDSTNTTTDYRFIPDAGNLFQKIENVSGMEGVNGLEALGADAESVRIKLGSYEQWVGRVEPECRRMKGVWGAGIALCFMFPVTALLAYLLWRRVHTIRTFNEKVTSEGPVYTEEFVPAEEAVMREISLESGPEDEQRRGLIRRDSVGSVDGGENQPLKTVREGV